MKTVIKIPKGIEKLARLGCIELGWRKIAEGSRPLITCSDEAASYLRPLFPDIEVRERVVILLLNNQHRVLGNFTVGIGSATQCTADVRMIVQVALGVNAVSVMMSHCHPSGNPKVSNADIDLTKRVKDALLFFDIALLDHVILLPGETHYSFADDGML